MSVLVLALGAVGTSAATALASAVTGVTATNATPSAAVNARTNYTTGFTATTGLAGGDRIFLDFPSGTDTSGPSGTKVVNDSTGQTVGNCTTGGATAQCTLYGGQTIAAGQHATVVINGATNDASATTTATVSVSTTADTTGVASPPFSIVAANPVGPVTLANTTTNATSAKTSYAVTFTTAASTGGLAGDAGSKIVLTFGADTDLSALVGSTVRDMNTSTNVGNCVATTALIATCQVFSGSTIAPGDLVKVTLDGAVNPSTVGATFSVNVDTTSDTAVDSGNYATVAQTQLAAATVDNTSPSAAAGAQTNYAVTFAVGSSGGLAGASGSTIDLTINNVTTLVGSSVRDNGTTVGNCAVSTPGTVRCQIFSGQVVSPGDTVTVTLNGITNPARGAYNAGVSTTSQTSSQSQAYNVGAGSPLPSASVVNASPTNASGARTTYVVTFPTTAGGGLAGTAGSKIMLTFPAGTDVSSMNGNEVKDGAATVGNCTSSSATQATCQIFSGSTVAGGDTVTVTLFGVINPAPSGTLSATVSTTSSSAVGSSNYTVVASNPLNPVSVVNASPSNAATARTTYVVTFDTSSTGGLSGDAGSKITLALPAGTVTTNVVATGVRRTANGTLIGNCVANGLTVTCQIFSGQSIPASDTVAVTLNGVENRGSAGGGLTVGTATTSDSGTAQSPAFGVMASNPVASAGVTASNTAAGATGVTHVVSLTTSPTGALAGDAGSKIVVVFPSGTDLSGLTSTVVRDVTTATNVGNCTTASVTATCQIFNANKVSAGDAVTVTLVGVNNGPAVLDAQTVSVDTTSDTPLTSSTYAAGPAPTATPTPTAGVTPTPTAKPIAAPTLTNPQFAASTTTSLTLKAVINPNGQPTTMHFEYGTEAGSPARAITFLSTDEQTVGSDFTDHVVTATVKNVLPNSAYQVRAVAKNPSGNTVGTVQTVKTPMDPPPPPPVIGQTFNIVPVTGTVFVQARNGAFIPLTEPGQIVPGAVVDARKGELELITATPKKKKVQKGHFRKGLFSVVQHKKRKPRGLVQLRLVRSLDGVPLSKGCGSNRSAGLASGAAAKKKKKVLNLLQSDAKGSFSTRGKYSSATVRGTKWDTADRCDGTLTKVHRGLVAVDDFERRKTVLVGAGQSYLATPR